MENIKDEWYLNVGKFSVVYKVEGEEIVNEVGEVLRKSSVYKIKNEF